MATSGPPPHQPDYNAPPPIESNSPLVALRYRDFRLLWLGQLISTAGSQMRIVTITFHLYQLTNSALALGLLGLCSLLPLVLLGLGSGVIADSVDRRKLMLISQSSMMLTSLTLAFLAWSGRTTPLMIYALVTVAAIAGTFDMPARQALIPTLVPRQHLPNALSLNIIVWQIASIGGPTLGGLLIAAFGIAPVYLIDSLSFFGVIVALLMMKHRHVPSANRPQVSFGAALEGLRFVFRNRLLLSTMLLDFIATLFGVATTLLPVFADQVLHVDERGLGLLYAAPAAGAVITALLLSARGVKRRQGPILLGAVAVYGLCMAFFALSTSLPLALLFLAGTGAADTVSMVIRGTMRQLLTPDELRGRMTSVNMLFFAGGPQLGEVEAGIAATLFGLVPSIALGGGICVLGVGLIALLMPQLRRYDREPLTS